MVKFAFCRLASAVVSGSNTKAAGERGVEYAIDKIKTKGIGTDIIYVPLRMYNYNQSYQIPYHSL